MAEAGTAPPAFPWEETMRFAFGRLRWTPRQFWAATPIELALAIEGLIGNQRSSPLDRAGFEALMKCFPD